jgi:hypothetical protein
VENEQVALWKSGLKILSKAVCGKVILLHKGAVDKKALGL